jgi:hypothetical protein
MGERMCSSYSFVASTLDECERSASHPVRSIQYFAIILKNIYELVYYRKQLFSFLNFLYLLSFVIYNIRSKTSILSYATPFKGYNFIERVTQCRIWNALLGSLQVFVTAQHDNELMKFPTMYFCGLFIPPHVTENWELALCHSVLSSCHMLG